MTSASSTSLVDLGHGAVEVGQGHAQADATAAGPASDLLLFLWGRAGAGPLERSGDPALLPRVRELAAAAPQ